MSNSKDNNNKNGEEEDTEEAEYEVESINGYRIKGNKIQFYIKWKGYSENDNTWEYESNLNCTNILNQFLDSLEEKSKLLVKYQLKSPSRKYTPAKKAITDASKTDVGIYYTVLENGTKYRLSSEEIQRKDPYLLIEYLEANTNLEFEK